MDIPRIVKEEILKIDKDAEIVLYGSQARGDYNSESDWDLLILLEIDLPRDLKKQIQEKLYDLELNCHAVISLVIYTKLEWEKRSITPFYQVIKKEGKRI